MNWTVHTIWDARGHDVKMRDGTTARVQLFNGRWQVGEYDSPDIWTALAVLNGKEAVMVGKDCRCIACTYSQE